MNNLKDKTVLIIYTSTNATYQSYLAAWLAHEATGYEQTLIDCTGADDSVGTDEINALVAAKTNGTYDKILILLPVSDTGASESMNFDTVSLTWRKLKTSARGTALITGTAQAAGSDTTHTEFASGSSANDYYNGLVIYTDGAVSGGAQYKTVLDYVGATLIAEVGGAAQTATDGDAYEVYPLDNLFIATMPSLLVSTAYKYDSTIAAYNTRFSAYPIAGSAWDWIRTDSSTGNKNPYPKMVHALSDIKYSLTSGTCAGAQTTSTVGDSGAAWTINAYAGKYVFLLGGTGAGQWANIASNTATVLTCQYFNNVDDQGFPNYDQAITGGNSTWDTTPVAASTTYYVVEGFAEILHMAYYQLYIKAFLNDLTDAAQQTVFENLVDVGGFLSEDTSKLGASIQDPDALSTAIEKGQAIYKGTLVSAAIT